jgi:hypothetical protein
MTGQLETRVPWQNNRDGELGPESKDRTERKVNRYNMTGQEREEPDSYVTSRAGQL